MYRGLSLTVSATSPATNVVIKSMKTPRTSNALDDAIKRQQSIQVLLLSEYRFGDNNTRGLAFINM